MPTLIAVCRRPFIGMLFCMCSAVAVKVENAGGSAARSSSAATPRSSAATPQSSCSGGVALTARPRRGLRQIYCIICHWNTAFFKKIL